MATFKVLGHSIRVPKADNCYFLSLLNRKPIKTISKGSMRTILMGLISEPLLVSSWSQEEFLYHF